MRKIKFGKWAVFILLIILINLMFADLFYNMRNSMVAEYSHVLTDVEINETHYNMTKGEFMMYLNNNVDYELGAEDCKLFARLWHEYFENTDINPPDEVYYIVTSDHIMTMAYWSQSTLCYTNNQDVVCY